MIWSECWNMDPVTKSICIEKLEFVLARLKEEK